MVPINASPISKWLMRCSTTATAVTIGRLISVSSPSDVEMIFKSVL